MGQHINDMVEAIAEVARHRIDITDSLGGFGVGQSLSCRAKRTGLLSESTNEQTSTAPTQLRPRALTLACTRLRALPPEE